MFKKPRFNESYDVHILHDKYVFLLNEHDSIILDNPRYATIAPYLTGDNSLSEIMKQTQNKISWMELYTLIASLEKRNVLCEGDNDIEHKDKTFVEYLHGNIADYKQAKEQLKLEVKLIGQCKNYPIDKILKKYEIEQHEQGNFCLVITDDYLQPELDEINKDCLKRNIPWLLVKPCGIVLWIGPLFVSPETGCWECLAQRQRFNRQMEKYLHDHGKEIPIITSTPNIPATFDLGISVALLEIAKYLTHKSSVVGKIVTLDLRARISQEHILVKRPQCRVCGHAESKKPQPIQLHSSPTHFTDDGGHRTLTPEETYEKYKQHVSPILGAVTELLPAIGVKSELTPSYVAGHNFSMGIDSILFLKEVLRGVSGGKGTTNIQAKVSGLCEAIERYSGVYHGDEYSIHAVYKDLYPKAFLPNECMGFSQKQYENRKKTNLGERTSRCILVTEPFDETQAIDWTPIWSLTHEDFYYIPTAFCYYGHPEFKGHWCFPDSNGTAAGNTLEEAILQGFMELIERDAVAIWWYNRIQRREVDLDSFNLPYVKAIREYYASIDRDIWVLDISSDLPVSTFACISYRKNHPSEDIVLGCGSHFDPKIALLRSITEVNQFLPSISRMNPDGTTRYLFGDDLARDWWKNARLETNQYLVPKPGTTPIKASEITDLSSDDLLKDVQTCVRICKEHNFNMAVLDQTREDIGLNVVKVVIPPLNHFWRRFGKERLYKVPVEQGWLEHPLTEEEFNPYSIFF